MKPILNKEFNISPEKEEVLKHYLDLLSMLCMTYLKDIDISKILKSAAKNGIISKEEREKISLLIKIGLIRMEN